MGSFAGIFFLVLACLMHCATTHTEDGKGLRDIICDYIEDDRGYVCDIKNLKIHSLDDKLRFTGQRAAGKTNEDVKYLHIHSSEAHVVPSESIFNYLVNLEKLEMKGVSVKKIDPIINCMPLTLIDLSENFIKSLSAGVFIECTSLEVLNLSKNKIDLIHENALGSLTALIELDLSENKIEKLTRKTIKPMKNLKKLSLQSNKISDFKHDMFNDMFHLTELDLSNNPLTRLDFRTFDFTIHIETLHLMSTEIKKFHPFTFRNLKRLRYLDISHNEIRNLQSDFLSSNSELVEFRMDNCRTRSVGRNFFDKLNKLTKLHANQNKCIDGIFRGTVVEIRPNFLKCFEKWDDIREKAAQLMHSGEEL